MKNNFYMSQKYNDYKTEQEDKGLDYVSMTRFIQAFNAYSGSSKSSSKKMVPSGIKFIHGQRSFERLHVDCSPTDVEFVCSETGRNLGRGNETLVVDEASTKLMISYVTFDPPSYRDMMMVIRLLVKIYHRLPTFLVADWGPEYNNVYLDSLLAFYGVSKAPRKPGEPQDGNIVENSFGIGQMQVDHTIIGNTLATKNVKKMLAKDDPQRHAAWTLERYVARKNQYVFEPYNNEPIVRLGCTRNQAFEQSMALAGMRKHTYINYDRNFVISTLPGPKNGSTRRVIPDKGIKVDNRYYKSSYFADPEVIGTNVPVRMDPIDIRHAYAFVPTNTGDATENKKKGQWVECEIQYAEDFVGCSQREIECMTSMIHERDKAIYKEKRTISAQRLALFRREMREDQEVLVKLRLQNLANAKAMEVLDMGYQKFLEVNPLRNIAEPEDPIDPPNIPDEDASEKPSMEGYTPKVLGDL